METEQTGNPSLRCGESCSKKTHYKNTPIQNTKIFGSVKKDLNISCSCSKRRLSVHIRTAPMRQFLLVPTTFFLDQN